MPRSLSSRFDRPAPIRGQRVREAFSLLLAATLLGCGGGGSGGGSGLQVGAAESEPCNADTSRFVSRIYVDSRSTAGPGCGASMVEACPTIQQGIDACGSGSACGVLVRHGVYATTATIELRDGVSVYGGCRFSGEPDRGYRTMVEAGPLPGSPAIRASGIDTPTVVDSLVVLGKDETTPGIASITMLVTDSRALVLTGSSLIAGRGGDGAPGAYQPPAPSGGAGGFPSSRTSGGAGGGACPARPPPSGVGGGGRGADSNAIFTAHRGFGAYCSNGNAAGTGPDGQIGQASGSATGGAGGSPGSPGCICFGYETVTPGSAPQASPGNTGRCAAAAPTFADSWGTLSRSGWTPNRGASGLAGDVGSGGGGGGGGGFSAHQQYNEYDINGYSGGGGGGGGCGGTGGQGGQQGGASIAMVLADSTPVGVAQRNRIVPGPGGAGGAGAQGSMGGPGGAGQLGTGGYDQPQYACISGNDYMRAPGSGGRGGNGGDGGSGSGGAGGSGGPSIGIARLAGAPAPTGDDGLYPGLPGGAGGRGPGGQTPGECQAAGGSDGRAGGSATVIDFDQPLRSALLPGQQLAPGQGIRSPDGNHVLVLQLDGNLCLNPDAGTRGWCSGSQGQAVVSARMQVDGNLCLYPSSGGAVFCSNTAASAGARLAVQNAGQVQILNGAAVLWSKP